VSPDGIKSFSFSLIDLYAGAENTASRNGGSIDTETGRNSALPLRATRSSQAEATRNT
jgi:hypothetical protein